jgi:hypothetical protein
MSARRRFARITASIVLALACVASLQSAPSPARLSSKEVIAKARAYVDAYRPALSTLVAEERYVQRHAGTTRTLVSDFALVRADDGMWVGFRDVWQVDGRELPDRRTRAERLLGAGRLNWTSARRIIEESARLNLGRTRRDVNTPIVALELLSTARRWCCRVRARRAPEPDPAGLWTIESDENTAPTLVRTPERRPVFARARYLVDGDTGAIRRTELRVGRPDSIRVTLVVSFARNEALGQWLPEEMIETVGTGDDAASEAIDGRARYERWRRFQASSRILDTEVPDAAHR